MIRRLPTGLGAKRGLAACLVVCALALPGCREERVELSPRTEDLLRAKADGRIASLLRRPDPSPFAAVVVFRSDVFLHQSALLDRSGISLLDSFDNVAVLALDVVNTPPLLAEDAVVKVRYLCPPRSLARFHPAFLMAALRRFGEGREGEPIPFFLRFRNLPANEEVKAVQDAGFDVRSRDGINLTVAGPPAGLPRLLEMDRIIYYEGASTLRTM